MQFRVVLLIFLTIFIVNVICNHDYIDVSENLEENIVEGFFRTFTMRPKTLNADVFTNTDYKLFASGKKLEDVHLTIEELIRKYGFTVEKYEVSTEDGYILTLFRIPSYRSARPIFLMHGFLLSADDWVTPGPQSGIAYLLAAEGFDVWLGNARGCKHSRRHLYLSPNSSEFWDFSWDEIGRYDLPAMIDFILSKTHQSQLIYVGHSQGTTTFFVMGSERPQNNEKISLMVALAPVAAVQHLKSPVLLFLKYASLMHPDIIFAIMRKMGINEFFSEEGFGQYFTKAVCGNADMAQTICSNLVFLICGYSYSQLNFTNLPIVFAHTPSEASTKQIEHYAQTITYGKFQRFDYGTVKNMALYGSLTPPEYNLGAITTPIALFYSANDWLATEPDVNNLFYQLNNVIDAYKVPDETFNHVDFLFGKDVNKLIFPRLLKLIKESLLD